MTDYEEFDTIEDMVKYLSDVHSFFWTVVNLNHDYHRGGSVV